MRRILRKIAEGDVEALGDTSTLADPGVVEELVKGATNPRYSGRGCDPCRLQSARNASGQLAALRPNAQ